MTFLKLIRKLKKESNQLKLVCVGLDNAGKTTILHNLLDIKGDIDPTFGYSLYSGMYKGFNLLVYDIGGQEVFREYWNNYFENCDGLIYVYDVTSNTNFDIKEVLKGVPDIPVIILGNKRDSIRNDSIKNDSIRKDSIRKDSIKKDLVNSELDFNVRHYYVSGFDIKSLDEPFTWLISGNKKV